MNTLWSAFLVGIGGSIGTLLRYGIGRFAIAKGKPGFYGTLFVNLVGSLAMGVFIGLRLEQEHLEIFAFTGIGILGGFTTYSTLNVQKASMFAKGSKRMLAFYLVATYVGGVILAASGVGLGYLIHT